MDIDQQLAVFNKLSTPDQIGTELQLTIRELAPTLDTQPQADTLLQAMITQLDAISATYPDSRILRAELDNWQKGRQQAQALEFERALSFYSRAIRYNDQNPATHFSERQIGL